MSKTLRGRTVGFDNLSAGNAEGQENTVKVGSAPPAEVNGGGSNISVGNAHPTGNVSDNFVVGTATPAGEKRK